MSVLIPLSGNFLLDTNIVIALINQEAGVLNRLSQVVGVYVPSIVMGEMCFGARKSQRAEENLRRLELFISRTEILSCDIETAREYGEIRNALRLKGRPIPENDVWIAAVARQWGLVLVTRDAHFSMVDGLSKEVW